MTIWLPQILIFLKLVVYNENMLFYTIKWTVLPFKIKEKVKYLGPTGPGDAKT